MKRSSGHTSSLPLHGVDGHSEQKTPQDPYLSDAVLTRATALSYGFDGYLAFTSNSFDGAR